MHTNLCWEEITILVWYFLSTYVLLLTMKNSLLRSELKHKKHFIIHRKRKCVDCLLKTEFDCIFISKANQSYNAWVLRSFYVILSMNLHSSKYKVFEATKYIKSTQSINFENYHSRFSLINVALKCKFWTSNSDQNLTFDIKFYTHI